MSEPPPELESAVRAALAKVIDPEIRRPITELGMVKNVAVDADGGVHVEVYLTTAACPMKTEISERVSRGGRRRARHRRGQGQPRRDERRAAHRAAQAAARRRRANR